MFDEHNADVALEYLKTGRVNTTAHKTHNPPAIAFTSVDELKAALIAAKDAHTAFEEANGPDADWPLWYARHMADRTQLADVKRHFGVIDVRTTEAL